MPDPAATGLYHVYDGAEGLLYIGVSKHFGIRWQQHAQKQPWWNERRRMTVDFYDDREEALDAEALAIFTEQPKYNVLYRKQAQRLKRLQRAEVTNKRRADVLVLLGPNGQPQEFTKAERVTATRIVRFRTSDPALSRIVESRDCWSCGAKPGELCRTTNGRLAYYHQARLERLRRPGPAFTPLYGTPEYKENGSMERHPWPEPGGRPARRTVRTGTPGFRRDLRTGARYAEARTYTLA